MSLAPGVLLSYMGRPHEPEPWGKATSYSLGWHATLLLLFIILSMKSTPVVNTILTEVKFIGRSEIVTNRGATPVEKELVSRVSGGTGGGVEPATSHPDLPPRSISSAKGDPKGEAVSHKPLSGPIIALDQLGRVGDRKSAFIELAGQTEGNKNKGLMVPSGMGKTGETDNLISMEKLNVAAIRKKEAGVGAPLIARAMNSKAASKELVTLGNKKKAVYNDLKSNPLDSTKWGQQKGPFSMEGPLKYRKILKMELPPYPRWAEEKGLEMTVSVRLWVNPKGRVMDNMYLEKTSGHSELDHTAMEALRQFIFVSIPSDQPQEDEWGVATFRFELKK